MILQLSLPTPRLTLTRHQLPLFSSTKLALSNLCTYYLSVMISFNSHQTKAAQTEVKVKHKNQTDSHDFNSLSLFNL